VLWGGLTHEDNYHVKSRSQKNAIDFLIKDPASGKSYINEGKLNTDYLAFDKPLYAPAAGKIIKVINDVPDNKPGEMNARALTGNTIIIETEKREYILLAHFKNGSIVVEESQQVLPGLLLGNVGNSGNSSEPHLHMQVMDKAVMREATGLRMNFDNLILNGERSVMNHAPVRGDTVSKK
jgi:murein DD-endopeptidase MepM/ murein hydrolase activator NlpD